MFIKLNIVYCTRTVQTPEWGVITTSRVVEDIVVLLKERVRNFVERGKGAFFSDDYLRCGDIRICFALEDQHPVAITVWKDRGYYISGCFV